MCRVNTAALMMESASVLKVFNHLHTLQDEQEQPAHHRRVACPLVPGASAECVLDDTSGWWNTSGSANEQKQQCGVR